MPPITRSCRSAWSHRATIEEADRAIAIARERGCNGSRARRRHVAGRTDRRQVARRGLLEISHENSRPRRQARPVHGRARHCARRPQSSAQTPRPVVSGRHLDLLARDDRRHGRQQFLRRPLDALRHNARQRDFDRGVARRRQARAFRPHRRRSARTCRRRCARSPRICSPSARARRTKLPTRFPKVQRRVGGYNLDALVPGKNDINLAHVLVGGEGTLAFSTRIELKLSPLLGRRAVGRVPFRQLL